MVAFDNKVMTDQERWAVVHYIQSLRRKDVEINDMLAPDRRRYSTCRRCAASCRSIPPIRSGKRMDPVRVPLNPLWPETDLIYAVAVRAVHDGKRLAILCTWRIRSPTARRCGCRISRTPSRCSSR